MYLGYMKNIIFDIKSLIYVILFTMAFVAISLIVSDKLPILARTVMGIAIGTLTVILVPDIRNRGIMKYIIKHFGLKK